jgi:hypothetical protein
MLGRPLRVVARQSGEPLAWRIAPADSGDPASDTSGAALVGRALAAVVAARGGFVPGDVIRGESLVFELRLTRPAVDGPARMLRPVRARNPAPAFSLAVPWEEQAAAVPGTVTLRYPSELQRAGYQGRTILRFVVDTLGRADGATVRDVWPVGVPRPSGRDAEAYAAFVAVARRAVEGARFRPARVAGCAVRQLVELPLAWTLGR